jgi:hypothetical protein
MAQLGDATFAAARARGATRSYREVMEHIFTTIDRSNASTTQRLSEPTPHC